MITQIMRINTRVYRYHTLMLIRLIILCMLCVSPVFSQVKINPTIYDYGTVDIAGQLFASYVFTNNGTDKIYLLKVEASPFMSYRKPVKAVMPGESDTLKIVYTPPKEGAFDESLLLYFSNSTTPKTVRMKGVIKKIDNDPTLNCYSFSTDAGVNVIMCDLKINIIDAGNNKPIADAMVQQYFGMRPAFNLSTNEKGYISYSLKPGLYHYKISAEGYQSYAVDQYVNRQTKEITYKLIPLPKEEPQPEIISSTEEVLVDTLTPINERKPVKVEIISSELPIEKFAYNNIVFLIDVSSSMSMQDRLPLLKKSMLTLINQLRPVDRVSIITYASNATIIYPSKPVTEKEELIQLIESLVANGSTSADKGLKMAYDVVTEHYISNGNNQLIIASDGAFTLKEKDLNLFKGGAANNQPLIVSVIGFGKNKDAQKGLKDMAKQFKGSYIHISNPGDAERALLDEIKKNSRKK